MNGTIQPAIQSAEADEPLLNVEGLTVHFPVRSTTLRRRIGTVRAVDGVDLTIGVGETLGLVGESGCGKTTTGQAILQLVDATAGSVRFQGRDLAGLKGRELRAMRRELQVVLQDPFASLNPRMTVGTIIAEPLVVHRIGDADARRRRVAELMDLVGLAPEHATRFPHQFSGGQRQRIGIARALALDPKLLILDEPVSSLDVSIQAQIVNLLARLQRELSLSYLLIAHDLAVVNHLCHRIAVMYLGKIVESGTAEQICAEPTHPYTQALLAAVPQPEPRRRAERTERFVLGDVPSPADPPSGCRFHTRCPRVQAVCSEQEPLLEIRADSDHPSACHFAATLAAGQR